MKRKPARRKPGFKEKMKDKQMKPSLDKDKTVPEEKKLEKIVDFVENPTARQKMLFQRYGVWYA